MSLLSRVFLANVLVLLVALALLTFSPITVDYPIKFGQFLLLFVGFVVLVTMNLVLLRRVLAPLLHLTEVMTSIDPDTPGTRISPEDPRSAEGRALAHAFNGMLDRLESARREAARTALEAQESERLRVAQELHDEIGQTLTAVTIQAERAAEGDPAEAPQALRAVANSVRDSLDEVRRIARELRPEALDDLGLVNALIALCNRMDGQDGPRIDRDLQGTLPPLPPEVELVLYRIAQESLTNAIRHAARALDQPLAAGRRGVGGAARARRRRRHAARAARGHLRASRACASGRSWWAAASRSSRYPGAAPRCGLGFPWTRTGDDRPAEDSHPARGRPRGRARGPAAGARLGAGPRGGRPGRRRGRGGGARALDRRGPRGAGRDDAAHDRACRRRASCRSRSPI